MPRWMTHLFLASLAWFVGDHPHAREYGVADEQVVEAGFFGSIKAMLAVPDAPKALLLLFAGGDGALKLSGSKGMVNIGSPLAGNFLVRSRGLFFERGFAVLVVDTPGGRAIGQFQRAGALGNVPGLIENARKLEPSLRNVPVWAIGTSAGTISVAHLVASYPDLIDGAIFTASVTRRYPPEWGDSYPQGVASIKLGAFAKPVLVLSHKDDACVVTPPADTQMLAALFTASPRKAGVVLEDPINPHGDPCQAFSPHGFYGMEPRVADVIAEFILGR